LPEAPFLLGNYGWTDADVGFTSETAMPKMKTHKASKKRFRVTATGKLKRRQAGKKHLLSHKTGKRKRHLREAVIESKKRIKKYIILMGGYA
jgi:large subunit ribosomal protein L35